MGPLSAGPIYIIMQPSREVAAVVQHVFEQCGARRLHDFADLIKDEHGRAGILSLLSSGIDVQRNASEIQ